MEKQNFTAEIDSIQKSEYLEEQKKSIASIILGAKDKNGHTITKVYARGDEHVIYEIGGVSQLESLKVYIHTKIDEDTRPIDNFQSVKDDFDRLKSIMYKLGIDSSYKQRAVSAIVTAIRGNIEDAKVIFKNIEKDAIEDYKHRIYGRLFYLLGSVCIAAIFCTLAVSIYLNRESLFLVKNGHLSPIVYSIAYATIGGFFSISLKSKELFTQKAIRYWMYSIYGAERLLFSAAAGIAAYTLLKSGIMFSSLSDGNSGTFFILSISFLSGFSETLIPNYMGKLEKTDNINK